MQLEDDKGRSHICLGSIMEWAEENQEIFVQCLTL